MLNSTLLPLFVPPPFPLSSKTKAPYHPCSYPPPFPSLQQKKEKKKDQTSQKTATLSTNDYVKILANSKVYAEKLIALKWF